MFKEEDFEDIRPYNDNEINPAINRIIENPHFEKIFEFFFNGQDINQLKQKLSGVHSAIDFQRHLMYPLAQSIVNKTSAGLTYDGFEKLSSQSPCLFIANHRDIVLDSTFLQMLLLANLGNTTEITFGSNLMKGDFVIDFGRINRMFKLEREGGKADLVRNSRKLSYYLRHVILNKKVSVWIAQRPGRTKNGDDKTEAGLLKMLNMSADKNFIDSYNELNIVPVVISYEYEPCCALKIKEQLAIRQNGFYTKQPDEDFKSIILGITQSKGRIHLSIADPANSYIEQVMEESSLNKKIGKLAELIDKQIYRHYKLWPNNFIAYDILNDSGEYAKNYTAEDKAVFLKYMENELSGIEGERTIIIDLFLRIYANPVINLRRLS